MIEFAPEYHHLQIRLMDEYSTKAVLIQDEQPLLVLLRPNHVEFPDKSTRTREQKVRGIAADTEKVVSGGAIQCASKPRMAPDFLDVSSESGFGFQASAHEMQTRVAQVSPGDFG